MKPVIKVILAGNALSWNILIDFGHHLYDLLSLVSTICWVVLGTHGIYQLLVGEKRQDD
jgi:hypothetical protein